MYRAELYGAQGFCLSVAVKRVPVNASLDLRLTEILEREAKIVSRLRHPNIVSVLDLWRDDLGRLYLIIELVDGVDLAALIASGPIPSSVAAFIAHELLSALDYAHEHPDGPIYHRDISPHNVLLSRQGQVKLADFGLARRESSLEVDEGHIRGKLGYISPEQFQGLDFDCRADLFSVGVVIYEMLTGVRPFGDGSNGLMETMGRVLSSDIQPPSALRPGVSASLEAVVMRLLERNRDARWVSAQEVIAALPSARATSRELAALMEERQPVLDAMRSAASSSVWSDAAVEESNGECGSHQVGAGVWDVTVIKGESDGAAYVGKGDADAADDSAVASARAGVRMVPATWTLLAIGRAWRTLCEASLFALFVGGVYAIFWLSRQDASTAGPVRSSDSMAELLAADESMDAVPVGRDARLDGAAAADQATDKRRRLRRAAIHRDRSAHDTADAGAFGAQTSDAAYDHEQLSDPNGPLPEEFDPSKLDYSYD